MYFVIAMATVYFARWVLLPGGKVLNNGAIAVDGDTITAIDSRGRLKRSSRDRVVNLGDMLLLPGLINMHTHLEESALRGIEKSDDESFVSWTEHRANELKKLTPDSVISSARLAIRESLANGVTTIADTTRTGISAIVLEDEPIRSWVFHEIHPQTRIQPSDCISLLQKRIELSHRKDHTGIAPYAVYSLSPLAHKSMTELSRNTGHLWSCHLGESAEELQAFTSKSGEIYDQILTHGDWPYGDTEYGPVYYAITNNLIPRHGICIHCNYMGVAELSLLSAKGVNAVFCPQYNAIAGHKPFPIDVAINHGLNVCLGTESPSISKALNLFDDLFNIKTSYPHLSAYQLISMVTENASRALRSNIIGRLATGAKADITGVRFPFDPNSDILEQMIVADARVMFVMVGGEEIIIEH
jgi:5-methylthioadenosine/S-adenosylhomocysteine deaminase